MGSTLSSFLSSPLPTSHIQVKDVLALCEDGDLLLVREKLVDVTLRVGVDFVVARDIQRMQCGQFPAQRVTSLPPWTSCEVLVRHEGVLHVVVVDANGLQLVLFEERITSKMPHIHDRFAIRRLSHEARNEFLSAVLRDLVLQIASVAPISWHNLLHPVVKTTLSPRSQHQPVDHEAVVGAVNNLPPLIRQMLKRMLQLFYQGFKQAEDDSAALGTAEFTARFSASFVAALYEDLHLLDRISTSQTLLPVAFSSACNDQERLLFTPSTAFKMEITLNQTTN